MDSTGNNQKVIYSLDIGDYHLAPELGTRLDTYIAVAWPGYQQITNISQNPRKKAVLY